MKEKIYNFVIFRHFKSLMTWGLFLLYSAAVVYECVLLLLQENLSNTIIHIQYFCVISYHVCVQKKPHIDFLCIRRCVVYSVYIFL